MSATERSSHLQFSLLVAFLFGGSLLLVALFFGCGQKASENEAQKPVVTIENLQTAYGKSLMRHRCYTTLAERAQKDRNTNVARLFQAAARSEQIHADLHASLLRKTGVEPQTQPPDSIKVGTVLQMLKQAMSNEQLETGSMYPNLIRTAELENFPEAVDQFKKVREADARHLELFRDAYDNGGRVKKTPYVVCAGCGYIMTSDKTEECPVCKTKKDKFTTL